MDIPVSQTTLNPALVALLDVSFVLMLILVKPGQINRLMFPIFGKISKNFGFCS